MDASTATGQEVRRMPTLYAAPRGGKISSTSCDQKINLKTVLRIGGMAGPKRSWSLVLI